MSGHEQLRIEAEPEVIPGAKRDKKGKVEARWVRLERTTAGLKVIAPRDVLVRVEGSQVVLEWK